MNTSKYIFISTFLIVFISCKQTENNITESPSTESEYDPYNPAFADP